MRSALVAAAITLAYSSALAQSLPPPSIPDLQRAITVLQGQRNVASDLQAQCQVNLLGANAELEKLTAKIAELEKKAGDVAK